MPRVLALRFSAIGDALLPIKYLAQLHAHDPTLEIDYLVSRELRGLAESVRGIERVHTANFRFKNTPQQLLRLLPLVPRLRRRRYDLVLDLQVTYPSRWLTRKLGARCVEFDRFSPRTAAQRLVNTFHLAGLDPKREIQATPTRGTYFQDYLKDQEDRTQLLTRFGLDPETPFIILNPASAMPSRYWPDPSYAQAAHHLAESHSRGLQFAFLGTSAQARRLRHVASLLQQPSIDLVERTSLSEAQQLLMHAAGMISEDSALMHLGWLSGTPIVALLGSSPSYWARPLGEQTASLDSANLDCAWCLQPDCPLQQERDHKRCLTQYTPEFVARKLCDLMNEDTR